MRFVRLARRARAGVISAACALASACGDGGDGAPAGIPRTAALGANLAVQATTSGLQVRLSVLTSPRGTEIGERTVALDTPGQDEVTMEFDLTTCLAESGTSACTLVLRGSLLNASGQQLDQAQTGLFQLGAGDRRVISEPLVLREVSQVVVAPASAQLEVGKTLQLAATLLNAQGQAVTGRTVTWSAGNSALSVTASGQVTAVSASATPVAVTATVGGRSGTSLIAVLSSPRIIVQPTAVSLTADQGATTPRQTFADVTNGGQAPLIDLAATPSQPWLSATLNTTAAPARLTISANPGGLSTGTYSGNVTIRSTSRADVPAAAVQVTFTIQQQPTIRLTPTTLLFQANENGQLPAAQTVTVSNVGSGTLDNLSIQSVLDSATGAPVSGSEWSVALGGTVATTTIAVRPLYNTPAGGRTIRVIVASTATGVTNSPQSFFARYNVQSVDTLVATPTSLTFRASAGGAVPIAQTVQLTSNSSRSLQFSASASNPSLWSFALSSTATPAVLTVQPIHTDLPEGTYTDTIRIRLNTSCVTVAGVVCGRDIPVTLILGPPPPGADIVVFNDVEVFYSPAMANAGNQQMASNLVGFTTAGARGSSTGVVFDCGHGSRTGTGSNSDTCGSFWGGLHSLIASLGYAVSFAFTPAGGLTSIGPNVKVLFIMTPCQAFTAAEIGAIRAFASEGGRVVLFGERQPFYGQCFSIQNQFLQDMGAVMTNLGGDFECTNTPLPSASLRPHQITTGVTSVRLGCSSEIRLGPSDFPLFFDRTNTHVLAGVAAISTSPLVAPRQTTGQKRPPSAVRATQAPARKDSSVLTYETPTRKN